MYGSYMLSNLRPSLSVIVCTHHTHEAAMSSPSPMKQQCHEAVSLSLQVVVVEVVVVVGGEDRASKSSRGVGPHSTEIMIFITFCREFL